MEMEPGGGDGDGDGDGSNLILNGFALVAVIST